MLRCEQPTALYCLSVEYYNCRKQGELCVNTELMGFVWRAMSFGLKSGFKLGLFVRLFEEHGVKSDFLYAVHDLHCKRSCYALD